MWILIKKNIGKDFPPFLSIHWAESWVNKEYAKKQVERSKLLKHIDENEEIKPEDEVVYTIFGKEHNESGAMGVIFNDEKYRIFPDEFSIISYEHLFYYLEEEAFTFNFIDKLKPIILNPELQQYIDAISLDTNNKTLQLLFSFAIGIENKIELDGFLPGWFEPRPEVVNEFS